MNKTISFLPTYDASVEQNKEYLRQCLPLMTKNNIPTNPINYAIWYEYVAGSNEQLNKEIDALIAAKSNFDADTTMRLYKTYVCHTSVESFEEINFKLQHLISQTVNSVSDSSQKASEATVKFTQSSEALADVHNQSDIGVIIAEIIMETKQLAEVSKSLKLQLDDTNKEMEQLRNELTHVREVAKTDALTGLLNRRAFDSELTDLFEQEIQQMCLAILDLDHFKRINDNFGHPIGDKVLKYFASLLSEHAAKHHFVARYGGEEMAMIMPNTSSSEAFDVTERIRKFLESSNLKRKDNTESIGRITVSIGIAALTQDDTIESFIDRADHALYQAKESGRNKVMIAE
ncbi:MAG: GGDEF domain-containing protein [Methylococcales bacterium]